MDLECHNQKENINIKWVYSFLNSTHLCVSLFALYKKIVDSPNSSKLVEVLVGPTTRLIKISRRLRFFSLFFLL